MFESEPRAAGPSSHALARPAAAAAAAAAAHGIGAPRGDYDEATEHPEVPGAQGAAPARSPGPDRVMRSGVRLTLFSLHARTASARTAAIAVEKKVCRIWLPRRRCITPNPHGMLCFCVRHTRLHTGTTDFRELRAPAPVTPRPSALKVPGLPQPIGFSSERCASSCCVIAQWWLEAVVCFKHGAF